MDGGRCGRRRAGHGRVGPHAFGPRTANRVAGTQTCFLLRCGPALESAASSRGSERNRTEAGCRPAATLPGTGRNPRRTTGPLQTSAYWLWWKCQYRSDLPFHPSARQSPVSLRRKSAEITRVIHGARLRCPATVRAALQARKRVVESSSSPFRTVWTAAPASVPVSRAGSIGVPGRADPCSRTGPCRPATWTMSSSTSQTAKVAGAPGTSWPAIGFRTGLPASRPGCGRGRLRGRRSARQGCCVPGRPARWTRAAAASPGCRCRSRPGRRPSRRTRTGSLPAAGPQGAARRACPAAPGSVEGGLHADRHRVLAEPAMASASAISTCSKRCPAARTRCSPTSAAACSRASRARIQAGVADHVEPALDPQHGTRRQMRGRLGSRRGTAVPRSPGASRIRLPEGGGARADRPVDVQVAGQAQDRNAELGQHAPRRRRSVETSSPQYGRTSGTAGGLSGHHSSRPRAAGPRCCRFAGRPSPPGPRSRWRQPRPGPAAGVARRAGSGGSGPRAGPRCGPDRLT